MHYSPLSTRANPWAGKSAPDAQRYVFTFMCLFGSLRYVPVWQPAFMHLLHGSPRLGGDYIMLYLCVAYMTVLLM